MSEQQLLAKYQKERTSLVAEIGVKQTRLDVLDGVIGALRMVLGEVPAPARRGSSGATGTKALILDALAGGKRLTLKALAAECQVKPSALGYHLGPLLSAGDIDRRGKSRATTYGIP